MEDFTFLNPTRIVFGRGTENSAGNLIKGYGTRVLVHYGGGFFKSSGLIDRVIKSLTNEGIEYIEFGGVKPNPRLSHVHDGIKICRDNNIDFILAIGGGSVIDSAKAIAAGIPYEGDVWDFYEGKRVLDKALPVGVILTIPAAGSETANGSVITNEDGWYKRSINYEILRPRFAVLNPELTFTLPAYQTACGGADIIAHIMERYFTSVGSVDLTDRLCEAAFKTIVKNLPVVLEEPDNYNARAEIMWTATIAHNDLLGTGRIGDWGSHEIEHELSAIYDIAHGAGMAVIFPAWMKYVYKRNVDLFAKFAVRMLGVEYCFEVPERTVLEGIDRLKGFYRKIALPVTLSEIGITDDRFEEMAEKCTKNRSIGNFAKLNKEDVINIYKLAL